MNGLTPEVLTVSSKAREQGLPELAGMLEVFAMTAAARELEIAELGERLRETQDELNALVLALEIQSISGAPRPMQPTAAELVAPRPVA